MSTTLCNKNFKNFYNTLQAEALSMDDILNIISNSLVYITEEMHIGKFEICIETPHKSSNELSELYRELYHSTEEHDIISHTKLIKDRYKNRISYVVFPVKGYSWSREEIDDIDFIIKNINSAIIRTRIESLFDQKKLSDSLTGLPNTECFMKFVNTLLVKSTLTQYTIIFSNLKNFNYINQQCGSRVGDIVLKEYGKKLHEYYNDNELIARFGGDNFVAILKNDRTEDYLNFISCISISAASNNMTKVFDVSARSGIYPITDNLTVNDAISRANAALSYAKYSSDKPYVWYKNEIMERATREREISSYFRTALARNEFLVYYQPKVNMLTKTIHGCEALVRWMHDGKLIPPGQFIPVLENEGSICELDFYMLDKVCLHICNWIINGITPRRVSVNFSKLHLRNPDLAKDIYSVIEKYNVDPKYIEIELTESSSYEDYDTLIKFVNELSSYGICTSIDDFGTGYSSLNLLKDLKVRVIKIDKSFVDNITNDKTPDRIILSAILTMIEALNLDVIAEGCETVEQARILKDLKCFTIQGYLFDKPLTHDEFTEKLAIDYKYPVEV